MARLNSACRYLQKKAEKEEGPGAMSDVIEKIKLFSENIENGFDSHTIERLDEITNDFAKQYNLQVSASAVLHYLMAWNSLLKLEGEGRSFIDQLMKETPT